MAKNRHISFRLNEQRIEKLEELAEKRGISRNDTVKHLIDEVKIPEYIVEDGHRYQELMKMVSNQEQINNSINTNIADIKLAIFKRLMIINEFSDDDNLKLDEILNLLSKIEKEVLKNTDLNRNSYQELRKILSYQTILSKRTENTNIHPHSWDTFNKKRD